MKKLKKIYFRILNFKDYILVLKKNNIKEKQEELLHSILNYACKHTKFYSELEKNNKCDPNDLKSFPFITKNIINSNFNDLVSNQKEVLSYFDAYTGGSTGQPLHFYRPKNYIDSIYQIKYWKFLGYELGDKILSMDGTSISNNDLKNNIYWGRKKRFSLPYGKMYLSSLYLTDNNIKYYVNFVLKYQPDFIRGYPSFVYQIAKYMYDNNIKPNFSIKAIQLTSESSFPYQWELISKVFNTKVCLQYGHTEASVFGYTYDETMKYIIEPLYGYTEIIKDDGTYAKKGEMGEIVVTSFYNKIMPFIRYKTGDYAVVGENNKDYMILDNIMGRTQDYIYNKDGEKVLLTALIFAQHFKALGNIAKWQIIQNEIGIITMKIIKGKNYTIDDEHEIENLFKNKGNTSIKFEYVNEIETTKRGKSKLLIQNIKND